MKDEIKNQGDRDATDNKNMDQQAVDKKPGKERGKSEKVANEDLKGKQVDADPSKEEGKPLEH